MNTPKLSSVVAALLIAVVVAGFGVRPASAASSWYQIKNSYDHQCMDNLGGKSSPSNIYRNTCSNTSEQMWRTYYQCCGDGNAHWDVLQNEYSGLCLDVWLGKTTTQNQPVVQYACNSNDLAQNFYSVVTGGSPGAFLRMLSAVCFVSLCSHGGYGTPTYYLASVSSSSTRITITYENGNGASSSQQWLGTGL